MKRKTVQPDKTDPGAGNRGARENPS